MSMIIHVHVHDMYLRRITVLTANQLSNGTEKVLHGDFHMGEQ